MYRSRSGEPGAAASAALSVFGEQHPLTQALMMAMAIPEDLDDVHNALDALPADERAHFARAFHEEMLGQ